MDKATTYLPLLSGGGREWEWTRWTWNEKTSKQNEAKAILTNIKKRRLILGKIRTEVESIVTEFKQ